ncbi:MAG: GDP-mannose 4,6-dehydratase, partial [Desulfobacula sp.]|nr:GDP-mannose 4,6-dehydratase [Desulfobacula sp.]
ITAIRLSVEKENIGGEIFQIATNRETTINEVTQLISSVFTSNGKKDINIKKTNARLGDVKRNFSDTTKAKKILTWNPKINLKDGLEKTINWFNNI